MVCYIMGNKQSSKSEGDRPKKQQHGDDGVKVHTVKDLSSGPSEKESSSSSKVCF